MSSDVGAWWSDLSAAALIGTARRHVPALPPVFGAGRAGVTREVALLDGAALGSALRRAGMRPSRADQVEGAGDDERPLPPERAVQLLQLLLHQSPVGASLAVHLVQVWLDAADAGGYRAPHHLLPELLDLATSDERLRGGVQRVADTRGGWLAAANPDWRWAVAGPTAIAEPVQPADTEAWARKSTEQRAAEVRMLRTSDPAAARGLIEAAWTTDAAADRATLLSALRAGIGPDDESFLERALDDRSAKVREVATSLLDALPTSARAARMADRLRPLVHVKGMLRKTLEVELPTDPDADGVRDGLARPKRAGSVRGWWLRRITAGAPLEFWTDTTRADPEGTWRMVRQEDARAGIVEAALVRADSAWAGAIVADVWHPRLLALVPAEQRDAAAARRLAAATPEQLTTVVAAVPAPWGAAFSRAVLQRLKEVNDPSALVGQLAVRLATGLDPATRPTLEEWADGLESGARERVARICQYLALVLEIPEAFR